VRETGRIRDAYRRREERAADDRYELTSAANRYLYAKREEAVLALLRRHGLLPLAGRRIIDIGCGSGGVLDDFVRWGAEPSLVAGLDLLPERLASARERVAGAGFVHGDAASLPWRDGSFDVALQFTLMTSVLDEGVRRAIAAETLRVLQPGGMLIWYDFIWNPGNRDTRGIRLGELRALYEGCAVDARRVTLAPPISRRLASVSIGLCRALEGAPFLRSHYLAAIRKPLQQ
jgi:SAM-dependent methyltransferase